MTSQEIRDTAFDVVRKGYNPEDVDSFLELVAKEMDEKDKKAKEMVADTEQKLYKLADKIEEYRSQEQAITAALVLAQKESERMRKEATEQARVIIEEARYKAKNIKDLAQDQIKDERLVLAKTKAEVGDFVNGVLQMYMKHIEMLNSIQIERSEEFTPVSVPTPNVLKVEEPVVVEETPQVPMPEFSFMDKEPEHTPVVIEPIEETAPEVEVKEFVFTAPAKTEIPPLFEDFSASSFSDDEEF